MANQHVTRNSDGTWNVLGANNQRATKIHNTQAAAIEHARQIAINKKSEVVIHNTSGKIRQKNSYGNDPHPPRG